MVDMAEHKDYAKKLEKLTGVRADAVACLDVAQSGLKQEFDSARNGAYWSNARIAARLAAYTAFAVGFSDLTSGFMSYACYAAALVMYITGDALGDNDQRKDVKQKLEMAVQEELVAESGDISIDDNERALAKAVSIDANAIAAADLDENRLTGLFNKAGTYERITNIGIVAFVAGLALAIGDMVMPAKAMGEIGVISLIGGLFTGVYGGYKSGSVKREVQDTISDKLVSLKHDTDGAAPRM